MRAAAGVALLALLLAGCGDRQPAAAPSQAAPTQAAPTQAAPTAAAVRSTPWDPRRVDRLSAAAADVAPALPATLDPPASAPPLADRPIAAAVLSVKTDDAVLLLGTDGAWRSVPPPDELGWSNLTTDGTRLVVGMDSGAVVWDLATGGRREIASPEGFAAWDYTSWGWVDDSTLLLHDGGTGGWLVDVSSGAAEHVSYPKDGGYYAVDDDGAVVEAAGWGHRDVLTDWAGGSARRVDMRTIGRLAHVMVDRQTVVGTTYEHRPFAVVVADRSDLGLRSSLEVLDFDGNYSPGLRPIALQDDGTVLLCVPVFGRDLSWRLVAWDPASDDLSLVTRGVGTVTSYATDLLG